jgi:ribosomal protein S12 methylthiotransferase
MKERDNICKYLDIPFQHSSDAVLKMMKRGHTAKQNSDLISFIRKNIPDITLRTTVITGHPGETQKDFNLLKKFIEDVQFDRLGVFTYSEEEDTFAAKHYKDTIPEKVKKERADELMTIQQNISFELNNNKIGSVVKVIVDGREGEYFTARSEADSPEIDNEVLIPQNKTAPAAIGDFCQVRITGAESFDLFGEPL